MNIAVGKKIMRIPLLLVIALAVSACGGGGDSLAGGVNGSGVTDGAGGGEVTDFGSVIFSDSIFETNADTQFTIDDEPEVESSLRRGMIATFQIANASSDLSSGIALRIDAESVVKGVVTSTNPLSVLEQPVISTSETRLDNLPVGLSSIVVGDVLTVYGFSDSSNVIQATRIQRNSASAGTVLSEWKLTGTVTLLTATTLNIGDQVANISGVVPESCDGGLQDGDRVEIVADANPISGFSQLNLVTQIECVNRRIPIPTNPEATLIPAEFEGIISDYQFGVGDTQFSLDDQVVEIILTGSAATLYQGGVNGDLLNGVRVEVEGLLNTTTATLFAEEIQFKQNQVEFVAPVDPAGINLANSTFLVMGIPVSINAATSDEVGILSGGISALTQLSVKGQVDGGEVVATEIRDEGVPEFDEVKLEGSVSNEIAGTSFEILGVLVTVDGSTSYEGESGQVLNPTDFFNAIVEGSAVEVSGELSISGPPTILADSIEIDE